MNDSKAVLGVEIKDKDYEILKILAKQPKPIKVIPLSHLLPRNRSDLVLYVVLNWLNRLELVICDPRMEMIMGNEIRQIYWSATPAVKEALAKAQEKPS